MTTLADSLDAFLSDAEHRRHLRTNTIRAYRYDLAAAAIQLTVPLDQLTLEMIEAWLQAQAVAPSTKVRRMASLQRFFRWAVRQGFCFANPLANREPLRVERRLPRPIRSAHDRDTLDAMIATAPQPYRLIFTILRETGMRVSEVLGLNIEDVTLERGCETWL
jgi:integrase/recombinase XerD